MVNGQKIAWVETARQVAKTHAEHLKDNKHWRAQDTAKVLKRSTGSVSQYLLIASWLKTHENLIRKCDTMKEAVALIKERKHHQMLDLDA